MTQIFTHPSQPELQTEVILASKSTITEAPPIVTMRLRYPRIIHAELMTHRVFSRNARSSRAVPVKTMLEEVRTKPFVPWHWGKNQKGMQAGEECNELVALDHFTLIPDFYVSRKDAWLNASYHALDIAEAFSKAGYHKQIANRLLEPFMWIDTLVTSTDWSNFLWLRDHKDAEPHLQDLARLEKQALDNAEYQELQPGGWHLPYITQEDYDWAYAQCGHDRELRAAMLCKISAARCARISYKPFDGDASYERELERYDSLVSSDRVHASPLEHQATPDTLKHAGISNWTDGWANPELHGNLTGYIQFRKTVPGERA